MGSQRVRHNLAAKQKQLSKMQAKHVRVGGFFTTEPPGKPSCFFLFFFFLFLKNAFSILPATYIQHYGKSFRFLPTHLFAHT